MTLETGIALTSSLLFFLLGVVVTYYYSSRRKIEVVVASIVNVIESGKVLTNKLKVFYGDTPVYSIWHVRLGLCNTGNRDIVKESIEIAPCLCFGNNNTVIDVQTIAPIAGQKIVSKIIDNNHISFDIEYLKAGKQVPFNLLISVEPLTRLEYSDIALKSGSVVDGDVDIIRLSPSDWLVNLMDFSLRYEKTFFVFYLLFFLVWVVAGIVLIFKPTLTERLTGVLAIINGGVFLRLLLQVYKKRGYLRRFRL